MAAFRDPQIDDLEKYIIHHFEERKISTLPRYILEQFISQVGLDPSKRNQYTKVLNGPNRLARRQRYLKHNGRKTMDTSAWRYIDLDHARAKREEDYRERYDSPAQRNLSEWKTDIKVGNSDEPEIVIELRKENKTDLFDLVKMMERRFDKKMEKLKEAMEKASRKTSPSFHDLINPVISSKRKMH
jgi:hypothetical protein